MSRERNIFAAAAEIADPAQRDAYLAKMCSGDAALRDRVDDLLAFEREEHSFLSEQQIVSTSRTVSLIGTHIDRYKLLEEIGEGGCGIVYMAEQREPLRRRVALKIIKPGMDTREVIARFDAERQALAMMDHPHIARVLDGGETEHGRPYFVMELVNGVPITEYCDANRLTPEQRLELYIKVCYAVQHAHQKGIIHRDIKPSNVLVTLHDGEAVPRVIDFGVAKAIGQQLTENTLFTRFGQVVGTPQYMSPEQAERSGLDVDTRSDIYSLGVLLYELLTGKTPLDNVQLKQAAFDELLRLIREEQPQTPSARVSTLGEAGTIICQSRSTEVQRLERMLRGDLDWIVMKALEKDRSRRFETAGDLVADIQRHLKNEPVLSRPPSRVYRVTKFVQRNRVGVLAAAAVIGALVVGLGSAIVGLSRAHTERNNAIASAEEAQTVLDMLRNMLATDPASDRGRDLTVGKMLDDFSSKLPPMTDQPKIAAAIHSILGDSYLGLDYRKEALVHFHREYDLKSQLYGQQHTEVARAASKISHAYLVLSELPKAYEYGRIAVSIYDALDEFSERSLSTRGTFGILLTNMGESAQAEVMMRRSIARARSRGVWHGTYGLQRHLAEVLARQGKSDEAILIAQQCFDHISQSPSANDTHVGWSRIAMGSCLAESGRLPESVSHFEEALELFRPLHGKSTLALNEANISLAGAYAMLFRYEEAAKLLESSLQFADNDHHRVAAFNDCVLCELNQGKYQAAERQCLEMLEQLGDGAEVVLPRVAARFLLALSTSRHDLDLSSRVCGEMLGDAQELAAQRPGIFSAPCAWALIHQANRTTADINEAIRLAQEGVGASSRGPSTRTVYLKALAHHILAEAYSASENVPAALEQRRLAVDAMPEYQLFCKGEVERAFVDQLLAQADPESSREARQFLENAVEWREDLVPEQILSADARMNLAAHLIEFRESDQDLEAAEKLLSHEDHVPAMETRLADDLFRKRWISLLVRLYDAWEKPDERAKWERR